jgi:hypothetical protein
MDEAPQPPATEQAEQIVSVDQSTRAWFRNNIQATIFCLVLAGIIWFFAFLDLYLGRGINIIYFILPFILLSALYGWIHQYVQSEFMQQFAAANGYTFSRQGADPSTLDGTLFLLGNNKTMRSVVSGSYLNCPISLFDYSYTTGSGKSRQVHPYTVFQLQFDTEMPDLLMEKKESIFNSEFIGNLPEHITLEGDFNKYFSLSIKKGYEVEALEIFTPDVMAELEAKCKGLSLEIVNSHLFIYDNKTVSTKADLDAFYGVAQYFVQKLGPVLARMKRSTEAMEEVEAKQS